MFSTRSHHTIDLLLGAFLVLSPYVFSFATIDLALDVFLVLGFSLIGYSLLTDYYRSVAKLIPLGTHLAIDCLVGVILILGPAIFGYRVRLSNGQYGVHVVLGLAALTLVALTRPRPDSVQKSEGVSQASVVHYPQNSQISEKKAA